MTDSKRGPFSSSRILATDLDGTLIPLEGSERNAADLATLAKQLQTRDTKLVFVTGRHFASVEAAIVEHRLPVPDWIICDVGTTIYERQSSRSFEQLAAYSEHLAAVTTTLAVHELRERLAVVKRLRIQESEKQGPFKLSFYADAEVLTELRAEIDECLIRWAAPYSVIHSVDPFNGDGLIDLLPRDVSKAYALDWWSRHVNLSQEQIVFAGDSGNDLAAFTAGYQTIVVGNADRSLRNHVLEVHRHAGWNDRLFVAAECATSGVLAGCRMFGLIDP
jgi:HAD superfamily hydrolase (TIGR01484 family)